jgi:hypothetical protein
MLIQHLLTERLMRNLFQNPEFTQRNVIGCSFAGHTSNATSWARCKSPKQPTPGGSAVARWLYTLVCSGCGTGSAPVPGVRYGPVTREQLIAKSIPPEKKFFALADRYVDSPEKDVRNLARALLKHFERYFAFLRNDGVETDQQCCRAGPPVRRAVAQDQLRKPQCPR